jgi:hypothetical protein
MSPLAFLVIAEALTRLIQKDASIKGIEINGANIKISQFADDTQLFAESYEDFNKALKRVEIYEQATRHRKQSQRSQVRGTTMGDPKGKAPRPRNTFNTAG